MRVQLFSTCLVDNFFPEVGEAVVKLLNRFGVEPALPETRTCCGKPADSGGYVSASRRAAEYFLEVFEGTDPIVIPSGSCASMVKNHYPELFRLEPAMRKKAEQVGARVYELTQFLVHKLNAHESGRFALEESVTYHASCQLTRDLGVREEPLMLLRSVKGLDFREAVHADRCCGFGGVFMVKSPEISKAMADEKAEALVGTGADVVAGADLGCLMNISDALNRRRSSIRVKHIASILEEASRDRG